MKFKSPNYLKPWNTAWRKENIWMYSVRSHYYSKYENQNILTPNQVAPKPNDLVIFILAGARPQIQSCLIENRTRLDPQREGGVPRERPNSERLRGSKSGWDSPEGDTILETIETVIRWGLFKKKKHNLSQDTLVIWKKNGHKVAEAKKRIYWKDTEYLMEPQGLKCIWVSQKTWTRKWKVKNQVILYIFLEVPHGHSFLLLSLRLLLKFCTQVQCVCVWGRDLPHQAILFPSYVSYHSTQFWHHLPSESIRLHRLKAPLRPSSTSEAKTKPGVVTCPSDWPATDYRFYDSLSGFQQFARAAHWTRETHVLTKLLVYHKGYLRTQINSHMKRYTGEVLNKGASAPMELGSCHSGTWKHSGSLNWELSEPNPFGVLWKFHYLSTSGGLTRCHEWDCKFQPSNHLVGSLDNRLPNSIH